SLACRHAPPITFPYTTLFRSACRKRGGPHGLLGVTRRACARRHGHRSPARSAPARTGRCRAPSVRTPMIPLTEPLIRSSFVNASKGDAQRALLPDLDGMHFERLDLMGWQDAKRPTLHYVSLELDGEVATVLLRGAARPPAKKLLCSWCEDIVDGIRAASFVAPLGGDSGRRGNTIGTAICADL